MKNYFNEIVINDNMNSINEMIDYYSSELEFARKEINKTGNIEKISMELPGIIEYRFNQLQTIESVLEHLNIKRKYLFSKKYKEFVEKNSKLLKIKDIEYFINCDTEIMEMDMLINIVSNIRNRYLGIMKGLENKAFQLNNITKLKCQGLEDSYVGFSYIKVKDDDDK
jgi:hypothetical protein